MYPVGHLAVGYVGYSLVNRFESGRAPSSGGTLALVFGTQFPDLVDKPLAWWFGVLPSGRTLAHSVYVTVGVLVVVGLLASYLEREHLAWAFGFGYVSHLVADSMYAIRAFETTDVEAIRFLAWPLTNPIVYVVDWQFVSYLERTALTTTFGVELLVATVAFLVLHHDSRTRQRTTGRSPSRDDETVKERAD